MGIFRQLFPETAALKSELQNAYKEAELQLCKLRELEASNSSLWESYNRMEKDLTAVRTELATTKEKVRAQNEADLMLVSAKIIAASLRGDKATADSLVPAQNSLLAAQQASSNLSYANYWSSAYGSAGNLLKSLGMA